MNRHADPRSVASLPGAEGPSKNSQQSFSVATSSHLLAVSHSAHPALVAVLRRAADASRSLAVALVELQRWPAALEAVHRQLAPPAASAFAETEPSAVDVDEVPSLDDVYGPPVDLKRFR